MLNYLTKEGLEKLKQQLNHLKTIKRKEIAEKLKHAASFGDLTENAAYDEAKDAQGFVEGKILELENLIKTAVIIKKEAKNKIQIGTTVIIAKDFGKNKFKKEKYEIVGPPEVDPIAGRISVNSPLGKKLLGLTVGDIFQLNTSTGKVKYKVIKIE